MPVACVNCSWKEEKNIKKIDNSIYFEEYLRGQNERKKKLTLLNSSKGRKSAWGSGNRTRCSRVGSGTEPCPIGQGTMRTERLLHYLIVQCNGDSDAETGGESGVGLGLVAVARRQIEAGLRRQCGRR